MTEPNEKECTIQIMTTKTVFTCAEIDALQQIIKDTKDLCTSKTSAVNPVYVKDLIYKVLLDPEGCVIYVVRTSTGKLGAFAITRILKSFHQLPENIMEKSVVLDVICAKHCKGRFILQLVADYTMHQQKKQFILLEALPENYLYYIKKLGAFSIEQNNMYKRSVRVCRNPDNKRTIGKLEVQFKDIALREAEGVKRNMVYPLAIDLTYPFGTCRLDPRPPFSVQIRRQSMRLRSAKKAKIQKKQAQKPRRSRRLTPQKAKAKPKQKPKPKSTVDASHWAPHSDTDSDEEQPQTPVMQKATKKAKMYTPRRSPRLKHDYASFLPPR